MYTDSCGLWVCGVLNTIDRLSEALKLGVFPLVT